VTPQGPGGEARTSVRGPTRSTTAPTAGQAAERGTARSGKGSAKDSAGGAPAAKGSGKAKSGAKSKPGGKKSIALDDDFLVEGKLEKPDAFYILRRSSLDYDWARLDARFSPLVLESVQDPLF
jgi:hypothetical protein